MFDLSAPLRAHAFLRNKRPTTWPEMVAQNRDTDVDARLYKVHTTNRFSRLVASLSTRLHRWGSHPSLQRSAGQVKREQQDATLAHLSSVGRKARADSSRG